MELNSKFWTKQFVWLYILLLQADPLMAQPWMPGYQFRKKITIDKSKVSGTSNLLHFPVLIVLQDAGLKYSGSCEVSIKHPEGLDISFASASAPELPIPYQLDHYDPLNGTLSCWLKIDELFTAHHSTHNEIYFYYGATNLHDPFSLAAQAVWSANYQRVWHMKLDLPTSTSRSANRSTGGNLSGLTTMRQDNFSDGKIGESISFNGSTDGMYAAPDTNGTVCITAWIKCRQLGTEQVILASDTTAGGYVVKIDALGRLVFESKFIDGLKAISAADALLVDKWYHITCMFIKGTKRIYVNGIYKNGGGSTSIKMGRPGALSIGRSKQNDRYFNGWIDELSIQNVERSADWTNTTISNQDNPREFINLGAEEVNPANVSTIQEFTGAAGTQDWANAANWSLGGVPTSGSRVLIKAGKHAKLSEEGLTQIGRLSLEPGAILHLESDLEIQCVSSIAATATIELAETAKLIFKYDLFNNGTIGLNEDKGCLVFNGDHALQMVEGMGTIQVARLELNLAAVACTLLLRSKTNVGQAVTLTRGTLNSNGNLQLLADAFGQTAALMPILNLENTQITGHVKVQHLMTGNFVSPATARGWWLLASPVFQTDVPFQYDFSAIKSSVFVTGAGGITNGFDASPNNGGTIYTHDQALAGSLSQKYKAISNMNTHVPLGKGFYLFSRGLRDVPNAYADQIQTPPFSNPGPYIITYSGKLFSGDLNVALSNRNTGGEGDGFNLLGNPYAAALRWGSLHKINVSPFIWMFDPKNNAYQVSDDPDAVIASGTGFFVRVNHGNTSGTLGFHEAAKYNSSVFPAAQRLAARTSFLTKKIAANRLKVRLAKEGLYDDYTLILRKEGNDGTDDADAGKIGEGYLGIAGMGTNGGKLAIDERAWDRRQKKVVLYVRGWASGIYTLSLKPAVGTDQEIVLADHYLDVEMPLVAETTYPFLIDHKIPATYGIQRFSLLYRQLELPKAPLSEAKEKSMVLYPNPFQEALYLKSSDSSYRNLKVLIRDIGGKQVWVDELPVLDAGIPVRQLCGQLPRGLYFMQVVEIKSNKVQATFKVIKN